MNTPIVGKIYHVVDKATNEVVKVGSTVRSLKVRWWNYDKNRYSNHFLKLVRTIESSEQDLYNPNDLHCPFLWHLVAAEQMEIFKMGTFRKNKLSNLHLPLFQKFNCFDRKESILAGASLGGKIAGILSRDNKTGIHNPNFDRIPGARKGGLKNVETGRIFSISTPEGRLKGGIIQGQKNAENGRMREVQKMGLGLGGKIGGPKGMHTRWHVRRGVSSSNCVYCQG